MFAAALFAVPMAASAAPALILDTFTSAGTGEFPLTSTTTSPNGPGVSDSGLSGVYGGTRGVVLFDTTAVISGGDEIAVNIFTGSGLLDERTSSGASGAVKLQYGSAAPTGSNLSTNLTGYDDLQISFTQFNAPIGQPLDIETTVYTGSANTVHSLPIQTLTAPGAQLVEIPLSSLNATDISQVEGIQFQFDPAMGASYRIDSVSVVTSPGVPEPATCGVIFAIGGLMLARRRARRS
jgi:uncharacterized protein with beta-barrel porin domain